MNIKVHTNSVVLILLITSSAVMGMDPDSDISKTTVQNLRSATPLIRSITNLWEEALKGGMTGDIVVAENDKDKSITVVSENRGLYTCLLTSRRFDVTPEARIKVIYNITTNAEEIIALNFLNSKRDNLYWIITPFRLKEGNNKGTFEAVVPQGESETSLIFYNYRAPTTSTQFTIYDLKIEVHPPFTPTPARNVRPPSILKRARTRFSSLNWGVSDASPEPSLAPSPASSSAGQDPLSATPSTKLVEISLEKALKTEGTEGVLVTKGALVTKSGIFVTVFSDNTTRQTPQVKTNEFPVTPGNLIKVTYDIFADEGGIIGFDFRNSERDNYYHETNPVVLKEGKNKGIFEAKVPEGESETSLIFYNNCATLTSTRFTFYGLMIEIISPVIAITSEASRP